MLSRTAVMGWGRGRRVGPAGLVIALAAFAGACAGSPTEAVSQDAVSAAGAASYSVVVADLTEGLELTADQSEAIADVLDAYRGRQGQPGTMWYVAADLQAILTADQIAAVQARDEARSETWAGDRRSRMARGARRGMRGGGERLRPEGPWREGPAGLAGLDLSEEQATRLAEIRESHAAEMEAIRDGVRDGSLSREEAGVRMQAIRDAIHEAMREVLTEEQLALLESHREAAAERREAMRSERQGVAGQWEERRQAERAAMVEALALTPEQVEAIDALRSPPEDGVRLSREEVAARREAHREALLAILDEDQQEIHALHAFLARSAARHRAHGERARRGD